MIWDEQNSMGFFNFLMGHAGVKTVRNSADGMRSMQKGSKQQKKMEWDLDDFFDGLSSCSPYEWALAAGKVWH